MMTDIPARNRYGACFSDGRRPRIEKLIAAAVIIMLILMIAACGKKAPPKPPEGEKKPPPVSDLSANVTGNTLDLSWTAPATTDLHPLPAAGFRVLAFKENRGEPCANCPPNFKAIGDLKVLGRLDRAAGQQIMRYRYPLDSGYRYTIAVISVAGDGSLGAESNIVRIEH